MSVYELVIVFFFKQKTAYEMRISDWSSDVCSSDLPVDDKRLLENAIKGMLSNLDPHSAYLGPEDFAELQESTSGEFGGLGIEVGSEDGFVKEIGRASCRERVCQYV